MNDRKSTHGNNKGAFTANINVISEDSVFPISASKNFNFEVGKYYYSQGKRYMLHFQTDGNFAVYQVIDESKNQYKAIWALNGPGVVMNGDHKYSDNKGGRAVFQSDGNLVTYTKSDAPTWNTNTWGNRGAQLNLDPDTGALSITDQQGKKLWSSQ